MPKARPSGLSKKVPAIFQSLPVLQDITGGRHAERAAAKHAAPKSGSVCLGPVSLLFELSDMSAKVMVMRRKGNRWESVDVCKYSASANRPDRDEIDWESLTAWIRKVTKEYAPRLPYDARILLTGPSIYITRTERPDVPPKDRKEAVIWQVADAMPFAVEESEVRIEDCGDSILVAAVTRHYLESVLRCFHQAGVSPSHVTLFPVAYQALDKNYSLFTSKNILLLHMTSTASSILTFRRGVFHSMRDIAIGGEHVTRAMMGTLVVDNTRMTIGYQEAGVLKEELGMPTKSLMPDPSEPKHSQLSARIRPIFEKMTAELKSSIAQFQRECAGETIEEVRLAGGASEMKGIEAYFSDQLKLPVGKVNVEQPDTKLAVAAVGLAGVAYANPDHLNFTAPEDLWKPKFEAWGRILKKAILFLMAAFAIACAVFWFEILRGRHLIRNYEASLQDMGISDEKLAALDQRLEKIDAIQRQRRESIPLLTPLGDVYRELSRLVPVAAVFEELNYQREPEAMVYIKGVIQAGAKSPDLILSDFLERLDQSPLFHNAQLESRTVKAAPDAGEGSPTRGVEFVIRVHLTGKGELSDAG